MKSKLRALGALLIVLVLVLGACSGNKGVAPPTYYVKNLSPGEYADYPTKIYNDNDYDTAYAVAYRYPDNIDSADIAKGYGYPPTLVRDWVTFNGEPNSIIVEVPSHEEVEVATRIEIPAGSKVTADKWVFWVSVIEVGQNFIQSGVAQRWFVEMN